MSYDDAVAVRTQQLQGAAVDQTKLAQALAVIRTQCRPVTGRGPRRKRRERTVAEVAQVTHRPWAPVGGLSDAEIRKAADQAWGRIGSAE